LAKLNQLKNISSQKGNMAKLLSLFLFCCLIYSTLSGIPNTSASTGGYCIPKHKPVEQGGSHETLSYKNLPTNKKNKKYNNLVTELVSCSFCQGTKCQPWNFQMTDTKEVMTIVR
jgi:hypothetical protein